MTRSMATHDATRCRGLAGCETCLDRVWRGKTPVVSPALDRIFDVFGGVVIGLAFLYLLVHIAWAVVR